MRQSCDKLHGHVINKFTAQLCNLSDVFCHYLPTNPSCRAVFLQFRFLSCLKRPTSFKVHHAKKKQTNKKKPQPVLHTVSLPEALSELTWTDISSAVWEDIFSILKQINFQHKKWATARHSDPLCKGPSNHLLL